jgi:hypothetical protein
MSGYVYFAEVREPELIKIGFSRDPVKRIAALQQKIHFKIVLLGCIVGTLRTERKLHWKFRKYRQQGEWFHSRNEILEYVKSKATMIGSTGNNRTLVLRVTLTKAEKQAFIALAKARHTDISELVRQLLHRENTNAHSQASALPPVGR